jgi:hypothetical protein
MRRLGLQFVAFLVLTFAVGAETETNFFPIMPWNGPGPDLAAMKRLRACGFTLAGFVTPKQLGLCRKAGLKAIVSDRRTSGYDWTKVDERVARRNVASLLKEVGKNPAVFGFYLRDEPGPEMFPGLETVASILREKAPGRWPYINLFPNYATPDQTGTATYLDYLQKFCDVCHPMILSYDHYAFYEGGGMGAGYWNNLEQMRSVALSHSLPFWTIVQAMGMLNFREPTAADLRFEVYSSLAYGARGIAYFQYQASPSGNFRMSAIDQFGNPSPTWYSLQNINLQIAALAPTLLQLRSDDVYHFASIPAGSHGPRGDDLLTSVDNGDWMAGDFTHRDGSRYVLIVNKNLGGSAPCGPHFRHPTKGVRLVSPYSGELVDFAGEGCWLAPGQGALLKVE